MCDRGGGPFSGKCLQRRECLKAVFRGFFLNGSSN